MGKIRKLELIGLSILVGLVTLVGCNRAKPESVSREAEEVIQQVDVPKIEVNEKVQKEEKSEGIDSMKVNITGTILNTELYRYNDDGTLLYRICVENQDGTDEYVHVSVDMSGNILNAYKGLEHMWGFNEGRCIVDLYKDNSDTNNGDAEIVYGLIDIDGKFIIEPIYTEIKEHNGKFYTLIDSKENTHKLVNKDGKLIIEGDLEQLGEELNSGNNPDIDFIYSEGKMYKSNGDVIDVSLKNAELYTFKDEYEVLNVDESGTEIYYMLSNDGSITKVPEGLKYFNPKYKSYWKFDEEGNMYSTSSYFLNENKIDKLSGMRSYTELVNGAMIIEDTDGRFMAVKADGTVITKEKYGDMSLFNKEGHAMAKKVGEDGENGRWIIIDSNGEELLGEEAGIIEGGMSRHGFGKVCKVEVETDSGSISQMLLDIDELKLVNLYELESKISENILK